MVFLFTSLKKRKNCNKKEITNTSNKIGLYFTLLLSWLMCYNKHRELHLDTQNDITLEYDWSNNLHTATTTTTTTIMNKKRWEKRRTTLTNCSQVWNIHKSRSKIPSTLIPHAIPMLHYNVNERTNEWKKK